MVNRLFYIVLVIFFMIFLPLLLSNVNASRPKIPPILQKELTIIRTQNIQTGNSYSLSDDDAEKSNHTIKWWHILLIIMVSLIVIGWASIAYIRRIKKPPNNIFPNKENLLDEYHLLRTLIDNMPDLIYIKDQKSRHIVSNKKQAETFGFSNPEKMIGKTDHDFYPKELADKFYWDEMQIIATGKPLVNLEEKALDEKGKEIYLSTTKIPLRNKEGEIIGIVGIGRNITDRKKAEQKLMERAKELQQANTLLKEKQEEIQQQAEELTMQTENLSRANQELDKLSIVARETGDVVIILDAEGNFEWVNESFTKIFGYTLDQFVKEKGRNILQSSFNPHIHDIMDKCRKMKDTIRYETKVVKKEGDTIWTQSTLTPILDNKNNIIRFVAIDSDITELKKAQELVKEQKEKIEEQRDSLQKLIITKDKFFSIIAHDLRNPFHSIMGFADLLLIDYSAIEDTKKQEYINLIFESSQYAYNLLENLLHWSRTQTERIKYSPANIDLYPIIEENIMMMKAPVEKKNLKLEHNFQKEIFVFADKNMVDLVIRNLLNNAIKFTPEQGKITITATEDDKYLAISVQDTGVGIEPANLNKLFNLEEFYTTTGTAGEPGTGLGLIVSKNFIDRHKGKFTVESEPGKGSVFTFTLPLKETSV